MSFERIKAVLVQEWFISKQSLEVIIDLPYFSILALIINGFIFFFLTGEVNSSAASYIILGTLFWDIIRVTQYSVTVGSLWNIWSRNFSNMFISPLSIKEYMFAQMLSGLFKSIFIFILISLLALTLFKFNIFALGVINLVMFFINLTLFAWAFGLVLLGIILRFGTRIQALAWGLIFVVQPLTATFFPVRVLPKALQVISLTLPPTYVFEAARASILNGSVNWNYILIALSLNIIYLIIAIWLLNNMFNKSKETGQFARNEG